MTHRLILSLILFFCWCLLSAGGVLAKEQGFFEERYNFWKDRASLAKLNWTGSTYTTKHFRVVYYKSETTRAYARIIGNSLERARKKILNDLGFKEPAWTAGERLDVFVKQQDQGVLGSAPFPKLFPGTNKALVDGWIEIAPEKDIRSDPSRSGGRFIHVMRALVAHEYFHTIQTAYDVAERYWLMESTATWVEDKVFEPPKKYWDVSGYVDRFGTFYGARKDTIFSSYSLAEYGAAAFFQYLSERRPGRPGIVKKIWEEAAKKSGHSTYEALAAVLGDATPFGRNLGARMGELAATSIIRHPKYQSTFSFRKLDEDFHKPLAFADETVKVLTSENLNNGTLKTNSFDVRRWAVHYVDFEPGDNAVSQKKYITGNTANLGKLVIAVRGKDHEEWDFRLITGSGFESTKIPDDQRKNWDVKKFPDAHPSSGWSQLVVDGFPEKKVAISAVNLKALPGEGEICDEAHCTRRKPEEDEYEIAAAFITPPVVKSLSIKVDSLIEPSREVWKVVREPAAREGVWRTRSLNDDGVRYDKQWKQTLGIEVVFSRGVKKDVTLKIGDVPVTVSPNYSAGFFFGKPQGVYYDTYRASVPLSTFSDVIRRLDAGEQVVEVPVEISAEDSWGMKVDANGQTVPIVRRDGKDLRIARWEDEKDPKALMGGTDTLQGRKVAFHTVDAAPFLRGIRVSQGKTIYEALWDTDSNDPSRRKLRIKTAEPFDADKGLDVRVAFNTLVDDVVVRLGPDYGLTTGVGVRKELKAPSKEGATDFRVNFPPSDELQKILSLNDKLVFFVEAKTPGGVALDSNPETAARYDFQDKRYYALENRKEYATKTDSGGVDYWHELAPEGQSIVFVLDASGSMKENQGIFDAKQGIMKAVRRMRKGDEAALIVFRGCGNIQTVASFTQDQEAVIDPLLNIAPSGGTPLGDAVSVAKRYMKSNAKYQKRKLLVFSDGRATCGRSPTTAMQEDKEDKKEEPKEQEDEGEPERIRWTAYDVETKPGSFITDYGVVEVEYLEEKSKSKHTAKLTTRYYPVSYVQDRQRIIFSVNWSSPRVRKTETASGEADVRQLRGKANAMLAGTIAKADVNAAVKNAIGPKAVQLGRR